MNPDVQTFIQITGDLGLLLAWLGFSWLTGSVVLSVLGRLDHQKALLLPNAELRLFLSICAGIALQFPVIIGLGVVGVLKPVIIGVVVIELLRITAFSRSMRRRLYTAAAYIVLILLEIAAYFILRSFVL